MGLKPGHCILCGPADPVPPPCLLNRDLAHTCQDEAPCCCNAPCATFVIFWSSSPVCWQARPWRPSCPRLPRQHHRHAAAVRAALLADRPLLLVELGRPAAAPHGVLFVPVAVGLVAWLEPCANPSVSLMLCVVLGIVLILGAVGHLYQRMNKPRSSGLPCPSPWLSILMTRPSTAACPGPSSIRC